MGTSYSAFLEEGINQPAEANESGSSEFMISEIDSDSDASATRATETTQRDNNRDNQTSSSGGESQREATSNQQHHQSSQDLDADESQSMINEEETLEESQQNSEHASEDNADEIPEVPFDEHQQQAAEDTFEANSGWGPTMGSAAAIIDADETEPQSATDSDNSEYELENFFRELGLGEAGAGGTGGRSVVSQTSDQVSTFTDAATAASTEIDSFVPQPCRNHEWMGRSLESLVSGYANVAPILEPLSHSRNKKRGKRTHRRKSENDVWGSDSVPANSSLNRKSRRRSLDRCLEGPFGSSSHQRFRESDRNRVDGHRLRKRAGPNVSLNLLARETTGKRIAANNRIPIPDRLKLLGGNTLYDMLDNPSAGMCSEVTALEEAIDDADWIKTQAVISRLSPRLIGDPTAAFLNASGGNNGSNSRNSNDPNLPPTAPRFYGGGGRIGLERDAFVLAGGIDVLVRVFREPCFVGTEMAQSYDARDLSKELVATNRLGHCWNESLACLRELVYSIPSLIHTELIFDHEKDDFLSFLFTLLSHDSFFDGAAALIEEILSLQSHSPQPEEHQEHQHPNPNDGAANSGCGCDADDHNTNNENTSDENNTPGYHIGPTVRASPPTTFFLGNVPDLYTLWRGFNCRQLAHFCRILALLIFEPEDRQLLESPAVLKSIELLQLRRNRAARAGRDSTVDMNQSILLGDEALVKRFLDLLTVMNFAPPLRCSSPFHIMAHFPYIADTLMMLGLHEFEHWDDITRYERLARKSISSGESGGRRQLHELGSVARMLESLSDAFMNNEGEPTNQLGHIITVIGAAQQAGVVIGRPRQRTGSRMGSREHQSEEDTPPRRDSSLDGLASAAGILTDQVLLRRTEHSAMQSDNLSSRSRVTRPGDAANIMQFNSLLLAPYQVEVLFVLCTLLGGRRKIDAQELLKRSGITTILDDMFQRLPWDSLSPTREPVSHRQNGTGNHNQNDDQPGIHGPGCECTPESALCVQYLRLLHNFCDRDCDNYNGRRLLLSSAERKFIFDDCHIGSTPGDISSLSPGLLSKVIAAFVGESDESPYRFWLASCVESYLRGSSSVEQVFVAKTGLVEHLIDDITSQRLHCAGSLQTSFDLLGELCKGNIDVLKLLVGYLDTEEKFRKLMSVAASNLVDSNVFIRSLLLSLERMSYGNEFHDVITNDLYDTTREWRTSNDMRCRGFLTHSWWETRFETSDGGVLNAFLSLASDGATSSEIHRDAARASDWFPMKDSSNNFQDAILDNNAESSQQHPNREKGSGNSFARFGWVYKPETSSGNSVEHSEHCGPNTIDRLSWFLTANRTRLLRDLLEVVNLKNINHENICCLNTAVVITIFANRRNELHDLLEDLKQMDEDEHQARFHHSKISILSPHEGRNSAQANSSKNCRSILQNFREVLWFWVEYYTHRGRDRLSLEFSSRLRFHEWMEVVTLLAADNGAPTALVRGPLPLPQSPYQRTA